MGRRGTRRNGDGRSVQMHLQLSQEPQLRCEKLAGTLWLDAGDESARSSPPGAVAPADSPGGAAFWLGGNADQEQNSAFASLPELAFSQRAGARYPHRAQRNCSGSYQKGGA